MELNVKDLGGEKISFSVSGIDVSLTNALRRIVISEVPSMAVDSVTFYENTSILNDEIMAHRLGLTPLKTDLKTYNPVSECSCGGEGCAKCNVTLTLEIKGPTIVHSGKIKSTDPEIVPVYDNIPLARITESQEIRFEAVARLGTGKEHMKWQAGIAGYSVEEDGSVDMFIESFNQLDLPELVEKSFDIFNKDIEDLKTALK